MSYLNVIRGGSWFGNLDSARSANRYWDVPDGRNDNVGFRMLEEPQSYLTVMRGGSWCDSLDFARSAYRDWNFPNYQNYDVGFRVLEE